MVGAFVQRLEKKREDIAFREDAWAEWEIQMPPTDGTTIGFQIYEIYNLSRRGEDICVLYIVKWMLVLCVIRREYFHSYKE